MTEYLYIIGIIISSTAAVLAWIAKLKWSKEFSDAKNAEIKAKEAQIENLKIELDYLHKLYNTTKLRESYLSMIKQYEEYIEHLKAELSKARTEVSNKMREIIHLDNPIETDLPALDEADESCESKEELRRDDFIKYVELSDECLKYIHLSETEMKTFERNVEKSFQQFDKEIFEKALQQRKK